MTSATRLLHETIYRAIMAVAKAYRQWIDDQKVETTDSPR